MNRRKKIILLVIFIIIISFLLIGIQKSEDKGEGINTNNKDKGSIEVDIGEQAPDFTLTDLSGDTVSLSDYKGKKVIINFWASWCPPCRSEMGEIQKYHKENKDVEILAINLTGQEDNVNTVSSYISDIGVDFKVLLDKELEVMKDYVIAVMPTTYFINEEGVIENIHMGEMDYTTMLEGFK